MSTPNINPISYFDFTLTAALTRIPFETTGEFVRVLAADEDFVVALNRSSYGFPIGVNGWFRMPLDVNGRPTQFSHIEFRRKDGAAVTSNDVRVIIGSGDYETGSTSVAAAIDINADQTVRQTPASGIVSVADKAPVATGGANATQLAAANTDRRCITVDNTGTVPLRVAGTEADAIAGRGFYIGVGASKELYNTSEIWAAGVGGAGACAVTEETF